MKLISFYLKRALCALFNFIWVFSLSSCAQERCQWRCEHIDANSHGFTSSRLLLTPEKRSCSAAEVELLVLGSGDEHMYFNVFGLQLPVNGADLCHTTGCLCIDGERREIVAERLQGGQKALLAPKDAVIIVNALKAGKNVRLEFGRFQAELSWHGFAACWESGR